jgi:MerR family transcriptional regulator, thiopeptide resistance regulator
MPTSEQWSTVEVARMTAVSSRTLRHYDHIGLLTPTATGPGGLRWYGRAELLRLQHVLLLRELGLGLDDVAQVLDGVTDEVDALRRHRERLVAEAHRLMRLAETVDRSIIERTGGTTVPAEELFDGFRHDPYAAEARERWGEQVVEAQQRAASWDDATAARVRDEGEAIHQELAEAVRAGRPPDDPAVQDLVARHHAWVSRFWTPDAAAYTGLGRLYVDDERFTATIDAHQPGLAAYLCAAIATYAQSGRMADERGRR